MNNVEYEHDLLDPLTVQAKIDLKKKNLRDSLCMRFIRFLIQAVLLARLN